MISLGFLKQKKWIAVMLVILGIGVYYYYSSKTVTRIAPVTEKDAVAVSTGTIKTTIQWVGTVTAASTQTLQFNSNGKIVAWNVKIGDKVKKGQVLAAVDTRDVDNDIAGQAISLKNAELSYAKLFTSTKDYQITQMENNIAQTKQSIAMAPKELTNLQMERDQKITDQKTTISNTETNITLAKNKIENLKSEIAYTKASSENTVSQSSTDLTYTLNQADISADAELSDAKTFAQSIDSSVLNFDRSYMIPAEFSAKDPSKKEPAITKFSLAKQAIETYSSYVTGKNFTTTGAVLELLPNQDTLANSIITACDALSEALNNSVESSSLSLTSINSLQSSVSSTRSKFANYLTSSNATKKSIVSANDPVLIRQNADNTIATKEQSLSEQQSSLNTLESNLASQKVALDKLGSDYEIKIAQKKDTIANLSTTLKANEQNLADMKNGPDSEEKSSALNQIAQAKISLAKAQKKKEDYQIIASFDGVVTSSNGKVGEISSNSNSSSTTATTITVEVTGLYKISVSVDQIDVVKVKVGQNVDVTFDSYAGQTFTGSVSEVDPTPTTSQGVVSYTVKILFQSPETIKLYNNMTATVTIITDLHDNAILVPTVSISSSDDKKTVRLWKDGRPKVQEITTGGTLGDKTEVLSWVVLGDKVIATAFKLSTGSASSGFSLFGGGNRSRSSSTGSTRSSSSGGGDAGGPPPGM